MFFRFWGRPARRLTPASARPSVEVLESRLVPYSATGNVWPHPQLITLSFVPDGTVMALGNGGQITSNLFATFAKIPGITSASQWQNIILRAAQSWAAQTNINFALVGDSGAATGSGDYQQGDPSVGDIRIGGYNFGTSSNWLASTFYPPSINNYSVAGDVAFNTGYNFQVGSTYDLFTVAMHEVGHALGFAGSSSSSAVMYPTYTGAFLALGSDDIAGVRSVYSGGNPRSVDAYDGGAHDNSFATAANISSAISPTSLTAVLNNLSITSTIGTQDTVTSADVAYYTFTAPANIAGKMTVSVQSSGLSLLSPKVTVYAADQMTVLGTASGAGKYGTTLTLSNIGVTPGARYYVKVQGADSSVFGTGAYALTLNLGTGANPTVPPPNTQTANGNPETCGGGTPMEPATNPSPNVALDGININLLGLASVSIGGSGGLLGLTLLPGTSSSGTSTTTSTSPTAPTSGGGTPTSTTTATSTAPTSTSQQSTSQPTGSTSLTSPLSLSLVL